MAAIAITDSFASGSLAYEAAMVAQMEACETDDLAWEELIETRPTTLEGLGVYTAFIVEHGDTLEATRTGRLAMSVVAQTLTALVAGRV